MDLLNLLNQKKNSLINAFIFNSLSWVLYIIACLIHEIIGETLLTLIILVAFYFQRKCFFDKDHCGRLWDIYVFFLVIFLWVFIYTSIFKSKFFLKVVGVLGFCFLWFVSSLLMLRCYKDKRA